MNFSQGSPKEFYHSKALHTKFYGAECFISKDSSGEVDIYSTHILPREKERINGEEEYFRRQ